MSKQSSKSRPTKMTQEATARIQSATAKQNDGQVQKGSLAARAQSATDKNAPEKHRKKDWILIKLVLRVCTVYNIPYFWEV